MYHNYDPLSPMDPYMMDPLPSSDDPDQTIVTGCISSAISLFLILLIFCLCGLFVSCGSTREMSYAEHHRMESLTDRLDSLLASRTVVQQDSAWREVVLRQFDSIREHSDTSHTVVVDTAGKVVRETLIINNVRERTSESDRQEREMLLHRLDVQDSIISVMSQHVSHSDSLLQSRQETEVREVDRPLSLWQQARLRLADVILVALAVLVAVWMIRKKAFWLRLLRKII